MGTSHRNFTEKTTDRVVASADERSSAIISRTALRRVMAGSDSLYHNPTDTGWIQNKIQTFKDNLRSQITSKKTMKGSNWPDTYAKMLREELEYIELCIEYNDKTGHIPAGADLSKPLEEGVDYLEAPTRIVGKIDLSKPDSKPEWK